MKELAWLGNHKSLAATEAVFQRGAAIPPSKAIDAQAWRYQAVELSGLTPPDKLAGAAHTLLAHIPFDAAEEFVRHARKGHERALLEVKAIRRLCFVARDLAVLTAEGGLSQSYRPLARACFNMGEVLDTSGSRETKEALRDIAVLQKKKNLPEPGQLKTQVGLQMEVNHRLQDAGPLLAGVTDNLGAEGVHGARKDFRRVAGLVVMTVAGLKWDGYADLAADGAALNRRFGQTKDAALASAEIDQSLPVHIAEVAQSGLLTVSGV